MIKIPHTPRDFQKTGLNILLKTSEKTLVIAPTGAGKTMLFFMVAKHYIEQKKKSTNFCKYVVSFRPNY